MSERERESLFRKISVLFLLASPLVIYQLVKVHYSFSFHPLIFTIILFLSMSLTLLLEIVLLKLFYPNSSLRFWVVKPASEIQHLFPMPDENSEVTSQELLEKTYLNQIVDTIRGRLAEYGFVSDVEENADHSRLIRFRKEARTPVLAFMDHSFFGEAHVKLEDSIVAVRVRVTFNDTLILETGEFEQIRGLSNYLSLKTPKLFYETVPLTLYCGLNLAFATSIVGLVPSLYYSAGNLFLTCLALGAAGMILGSLFLMQKNRERLFGYRLAFAGLYLAALPFGAMLIESFRQ